VSESALPGCQRFGVRKAFGRLIGDSGTWKSHLLTASGTAAAEQGHRVRYTLASKLVNEIDRASNSADGCGEPGQPAFLARASVTDTGHSKFSPRR